MAKQINKIIHVKLNKPYKGKSNYYFGSMAAIYDELPEHIVGIKLISLWNVNLKQYDYSNALCTIRMDELKRKATERGKFHSINNK